MRESIIIPTAPGPADALRLAAVLWHIDATEAVPLAGYGDENFRLRLTDGGHAILKVSAPGESRTVLDAQNAALEHLSAACDESDRRRLPRALPRPGGGERLAAVATESGSDRLVRVLTYLPGTPLAAYRPRSPELLEDVGRLLGRLDGALAGFEHPGAERTLEWDLRRGADVVAQNRIHIKHAGRRERLDRVMARLLDRVTPKLDSLRQAVIHGDANDYNILVAGGSARSPAPPRAAGLVDFGDMHRSYVAAEPAIAIAYAMLGRRDPVPAAARLVRGYHAEHPLTETELAVVFELALLRLCVSVSLSARESVRDPENTYLRVSEAPAWELLERLEAVHPTRAQAILRHACGLDPSPAGTRTARWLRAHPEATRPVLSVGAQRSDRVLLDLSVGSTALDGLAGDAPAAAWTDWTFGRMRAAGARVGLGRYDEARRWYTTDAYRVDTDGAPEWRTIHIGVDLFAEPGTPVHAPLDGVVHALRDNARRLDYGPTVILRHEPAEGVAFYTLYGHLTGDSLAALEVGRTVRAGEVVARIGAPPENGDWAPHLHLQLMVDLLGRDGEFPGVARPSERDVWLALCPDPNLLLRYEELAPAGTPDAGELLERRRRAAGPSLSLSYDTPLHIVRGWRQHLYDAAGQAYLDCVNNVAHVGHSHPRVVEALSRQAATLNTNTRYLHEARIEYMERLVATLPEPLRVCYLVCSGSEANELALRLARAHTGRRGVVVLEGAYHGNTTTLIDLSPYKHDGPGGAGAPPWVRAAAMPDPYRGARRGPDAGAAYADDVDRAAHELERAGHGVAAFFAEPVLSCGGQIVPPDRYLAEAFRRVRTRGGVCVADEVQIGFGRVGHAFWGFEAAGAVPDIVTMGKPAGNGHPLAAVVTTPEIAASFHNGMEYFNTFGGNPVSAAVGLAVLDVMESEKLQANARDVGARLLHGLRGLVRRHEAAGDARGLGLFLGLELVRDPGTREPAPEVARYVVERMKSRGILLSADGPAHNVIKIKPPLVFDAGDADRLVAALDDVLGETPLRRA